MVTAKLRVHLGIVSLIICFLLPELVHGAGGQREAAPDLVGRWQGQGTDPDGTRWTAEAQITSLLPGPCGRVRYQYADHRCSGIWFCESPDKPPPARTSKLYEVITSGSCFNGDITANLAADGRSMGWLWSDGQFEERTELTRQASVPGPGNAPRLDLASSGCQIWRGRFAGNATTLIEMKLCTAAGQIFGVAQHTSAAAGTSVRSLRGTATEGGRQLVLREDALLQSIPNAGWEHCPIERYDLRVESPMRLVGSYDSAACHDHAEGELTLDPDLAFPLADEPIDAGLSPLHPELTVNQVIAQTVRSLQDETRGQVEVLHAAAVAARRSTPELADPTALHFALAQGRMAKRLALLDRLVATGKLQGTAPRSQLEVVSTADLGAYRFQLEDALARLAQARGRESPLQQSAFHLLRDIQAELARRGVATAPPTLSWAGYRALSEKRHALIQQMNELARQDARYVIDASSYILNGREAMNRIQAEVQDIDRRLGHDPLRPRTARDLLTPQTLRHRLDVLRAGAERLTAKASLLGHYCMECDQHAKITWDVVRAEQLRIENRFTEYITSSHAPRGPPDLKVKDLYSALELSKIERDIDVVLRTETRRTMQTMRALLPSNLSWALVDCNRPSITPLDVVSRVPSREYFQLLSHSYYRAVLLDPTSAALWEGELRASLLKLGIAPERVGSINHATLLAPVDLDSLSDLYERAQKNMALQESRKGRFFSSGNQLTSAMIRQLGDELTQARKLAEQRLASGTGPRPPPSEIEQIVARAVPVDPTEQDYRAIVTEQQRALQRMAARYGSDAPPGIEVTLRGLQELEAVSSARTARAELERQQIRTIEELFKKINSGGQELLNNPTEFGKVFAEAEQQEVRTRQTLAELENRAPAALSAREKESLLGSLRRGLNLADAGPDQRTRREQKPQRAWYREPVNADKSARIGREGKPGGIWLSQDGKELMRPAESWVQSREVPITSPCKPDEKRWVLNAGLAQCWQWTDNLAAIPHWLKAVALW